MIRIISGQWGGQNIAAKPSPKMRPTSDKVREALFSQLEARWITSWDEIVVLDLFAGSGAFGFEALSRGASFATFVDHHLQTVKAIETAAKNFETTDKVEILCKGSLEAIRWLHNRGTKFDLIFLDPPYREDWVLATLNSLANFPLLKRKGLVIAEYDKREAVSQVEAVWKQEDARRYGDTTLAFFTPKEL